MAFSTQQISISPADGWTLVATNPVTVIVRARDCRPFQVAVTAAGAPAATSPYQSFDPASQEDGWQFRMERSAAMTCEVYVRTVIDGALGEKMVLGVIRDQ